MRPTCTTLALASQPVNCTNNMCTYVWFKARIKGRRNSDRVGEGRAALHGAPEPALPAQDAQAAAAPSSRRTQLQSARRASADRLDRPICVLWLPANNSPYRSSGAPGNSCKSSCHRSAPPISLHRLPNGNANVHHTRALASQHVHVLHAYLRNARRWPRNCGVTAAGRSGQAQGQAAPACS